MPVIPWLASGGSGLGSKSSKCPGRRLGREQMGGVERPSSDGAPGGTRVTSRPVYLSVALAVTSAYVAPWAPIPLPTGCFHEAPGLSHPFTVPFRSRLCPFYVPRPFLLPSSVLIPLCNR